MKLLLKLAWRNIWRNKRRSLLTLAAIGFATTVAIATRGFQFGTYDLNIRYVGELMSGFLQVQKPGYQKNPSIRKGFKFDDKLAEIIKSDENVKGFAPRIVSDGLISFGNKTQGTAIFGIDPSMEKKASKIIAKLNKGRFFKGVDSDEIVVGSKLLQLIDAEIGDTVVILSQGADGSMGNLKFKITGTVKFGLGDVDKTLVFMGLNTARELTALYGRVNLVAINVFDLNILADTKTRLLSKLDGDKLNVVDWMEIMPDLKNSIDFDNISGALMMFILIVIVAFGILNTILMSVSERFKEFGISLSIGMSQNKLVLIVALEALFLSIIGICLGDLAGYFINHYFTINPIEFGSEMSELYKEYGFLPQLKSMTASFIFIHTSLVIFIVSIVASIYPMIKVYRLEPLKGIRYT